MRYMVIVSHGKFADGLANALSMLVGAREDVISAGLEDGKSADEFVVEFKEKIAKITPEDDVLMLGDLIGGSPLTNAMNVLAELGIKNVVVGGMNLPLALTGALTKDAVELAELPEAILGEAHDALKEFKVESDEEDDI